MSAARPLRVLLVDDVADLRMLVRTLFDAYPDVEVVGEAGDGLTAIQLAEQTQPDLVVLDLTMPVMDGVQALPELRRVAPHARVVVLTAIPQSVDPGAMAAGAVAYVEKSVRAAQDLVPDLLAGAGLLDVALAALDVESDARDEFAADHTSPGSARRFARAALSGQGDPVVETVELLISEMVTNAVVHARSAASVSIQVLRDRVHVEVVDTAPEGPRVGVEAPEEAESGRGMGLVDVLACAWGVTPLADGKIVWFDVERTPVPQT